MINLKPVIKLYTNNLKIHLKQRTIIFITIVLMIPGCALPSRDSKQPNAFRIQTQAFVNQNNQEYDAIIETIFKRMEMEVSTANNSVDATFDILILHGGGASGGFAAGVLKGWEEIEDSYFSLPECDMVTGASSGALVAPLAFVGGRESYQIAYDFALNPPDFAEPGILSLWPTRGSVMSNTELQKTIGTLYDADLVARIRKGAQEHRSLLIGTTDLELGLGKTWDVSNEVRKSDTETAKRRLHEVLLASTALPVAFPPVEIDGHLYTDGGVASTMFMGVDANGIRSVSLRWRRLHPGWPMPKIRIWIIVNAKLFIDEKTVQPRYFEVAMRSIDIMMAYDRIKALFALAFMAYEMNSIDGVQAELRYIAIPETATIPTDISQMSDRVLIEKFVETGRRLGADSTNWTQGAPEVYRMPTISGDLSKP